MPNYETAKENLTALIDFYNKHDDIKNKRNETTTRLHLIDTVFFDCLDWDKIDCTAEKFQSGDFLDYIFSAPHYALIVEAKKEGIFFELPCGFKKIECKIKNLIDDCPDIKPAIEQVANYCFNTGIRFAVVTNGFQYIVFVALTYGKPYTDGKALVFDSLEKLRDNFKDFWDAISKEAIQKSLISIRLSVDEQTPPLSKFSEVISNYPGIRQRNVIQNELEILSDILINELSEYDEIKEVFLKECYCKSGAYSQYAYVCKNVLENRYTHLFPDIKKPSLESVSQKSGEINPQLLSHSSCFRPIILMGDVGVGKSTFIKYLFNIEHPINGSKSIIIHINLGSNAIIDSDINQYILEEIENQLESKYGIETYEYNFIKGIYHKQLIKFKAGIASKLVNENSQKYAEEEYNFLKGLQENKARHLKSIINHLVKGRNQKVIIIIDNVDQRSEMDQQNAFLIATEFAANLNIPVFITIRPETFYKSQKIGSLSAYHPVAYTISPPRIDEVLTKRLKFSLKIINGELSLNKIKDITLNLKNLENFILIFLESLQKSDNILKFLDNVSNCNVRLALSLVNTFIKSGHINTKEILEIFEKQKKYLLPVHAIQRAIIYGETEYYDPNSSPIINLYDLSVNHGGEHFLCLIILNYLEKKSVDVIYGGFVSLQELFLYCQNCGYNESQIKVAVDRLLSGRAVEDNVHNNLIQNVINVQMIRITSYGTYLLKELCKTFTYLDAVIIDTPINNRNYRDKFSFDSNDITSRIKNLKIFIDYLDSEATNLICKDFKWQNISDQIRSNIKLVESKITKVYNSD